MQRETVADIFFKFSVILESKWSIDKPKNLYKNNSHRLQLQQNAFHSSLFARRDNVEPWHYGLIRVETTCKGLCTQ